MLPGEVIEGKHKPLVSKKDFLIINSERTTQLKEYKTDNEMLPLKHFVYCESCHKPLTGYLVKKKGLYYYKCRTKGCCCNKSAKKLHLQFENKLRGYQIDYKYLDVIKDVMTYTYDSLTKEKKENESSLKKQISGLQSKLETMEERFAIGEINKEIYEKFKVKYQSEISDLESNLLNSTLSSSNLQKAINKALKISSNLNELWVSGDLTQKKKIQNLVFPFGIGYNKLNGEVRTKKVNSVFSSIPMISEGLAKIKSGEPINIDQFSARVTLPGFKPGTF